MKIVKERQSPQESLMIGRATIANFTNFQNYSTLYLPLIKWRQIVLDVDFPLLGYESDFFTTKLMMRD